MCNAWNHPTSCTCGFGGTGHLGRRGSETPSSPAIHSTFFWVPPIFQTYESYVIPNARCPNCSAPVFFYQSPNGGRVFFDELGPPWPKHPCTDNSSVPHELEFKTNDSKIEWRNKNYKWKSSGWSPFFIPHVHRVSNNVLRIVGSLKENDFTIYAKMKINPYGDPNPITNESIAYLKKTSKAKYDLSIASEFPKHLKAFVSLLYIH